MSRAARCLLAIAAAALAFANCSDSTSVGGPAPVAAAISVNGVPADRVLLVGGTLDLFASVTDTSSQPISGGTVAWSSSNTAVATVSADGVVTGISAGAVTIKAMSGAVFDSVSLSVRVAIHAPPPAATVPVVQSVLGGRVTISIPPGAVPDGLTQLTIGPASAPPASAELVGGTAFDFGPSGTQFSVPLSLTVKFDGTGVPATDRAGLAIYHVVGNNYDEVTGSVVDTVANTVTAPISSFSSYAILRRAPPASIMQSTGDRQAGIAGAAVSARPAVRLLDTHGHAASFARVTFAIVSGGGSIADPLAIADGDGIATAGTWTLGPAVGVNTLTATVTGLPPVTFTATGAAGPPAKLVVVAQPTSTTLGAVLAPIAVTARDAHDNATPVFTGAVSLALGVNPGGATLGGATTADAVAGTATFATLTLDRSGAGYTLVASAPGLASATSNAFDVAGGVARQLDFGTYPTNVVIAGNALTLTVVARDPAGNIATNFTGTVSLSLASGAGAMEGANTASAVGGVATFSAVRLNIAGMYRFTATAPGLTAAVGGDFQVGASSPVALTLFGGGLQTAFAGAALPLPILVQLTDTFGNPVAEVRTVNFVVASGGGNVAPASVGTDASGQASTVWTLGPTGPQTLNATSAGLGSLAVAATLRLPPVISIVSGGGQTGNANAALPQPIIVRVNDAAGVVAGQALTFAVTSGGGSVAPGSAITDVSGYASATWTLGAAGAQNISVSAAGMAPLGVTASVRIPSALAFVSGGGQSGAAGTTLPNAVVVKVTDAVGVGVPGQTVSFTATDGGSLSPSSATTDESGIVMAWWTLGSTVGAQTVTVHAAFTANTLTVNATATVPPVPALYLYTYDPYYGAYYGEYWDGSLGIGQRRTVYVRTEQFAPVAAPLTVTLSHSGGPHTGAPATVTIPAGAHDVMFDIVGTTVGTDELVASATGYTTATATTVVDKGTLDLIINADPATLRAGDSVIVTLIARGPVSGYNAVLAAAATFALGVDAHLQFVSGGPASVPINSATIQPGEFYAVFWAKGVSAGDAKITASNPDYVTLNATFTVFPNPPSSLVSAPSRSPARTATRYAVREIHNPDRR